MARCACQTIAGAIVAMCAMIATPDVLHAQNTSSPYRADVMTLAGGLAVTNGFDDRFFASTWGNLWLQSGLGLHAEAHYADREETAGFFVGGVSWNSAITDFKVALGTSTDNVGILPETYARAELAFKSPPEVGWVLTPSATYREYRNTAEELALEAQVLRYIPFGPGSLILQGLGRATFIDPGDHIAPSYGAGLQYAEAKRFSVGLLVEGGRASYDAVFGGIGFIDEKYVSVRPSMSLFLTDRIELIGRGEWTDRESFTVTGGYAGLKLYFE